MARFGLTIQKKFLLLFLLVGLLPAALGVAVAAIGARWAFSSALRTSAQGRAAQIATGLAEFGGRMHGRLLGAVSSKGADLEALAAEAQQFGGIDAVAVVRPDSSFDVRVLTSREPELEEHLRRRAAYFATFSRDPNITAQGYFGDVNLKPEGVAGPDIPLAIMAYRAADGSFVAFLTNGDRMLRQIRDNTGVDVDSVHLYSRRGYMLTRAPAPAGFLEAIARRFDDETSSAPGAITLEGPEMEERRVVGHAMIPGISRLVAERRIASSWIVLVAEDMEVFLAPLARFIWTTAMAALGWALVVMAISVFATRRIVGPVKHLRRQAEALTAGNLDAQVRVRTHDEIHDLAEAFNTMAARLKKSHADLEARAEENRLRAEHIKVINEITKAITQSMNLDKTFEILVRDLRNAIHYDGMWIAMKNEQTGRLDVTHADPEWLAAPLRRGEVPLDFTFEERAIREREAARGIIGAADDSDAFQSGIYRNLGFASYLVAPLPSFSGVLGTLTLASKDANAFGEEATGILASVAGAVAIGIEQAELFERTRRFAQELEQKIQERSEQLNRANKKLVLTEKYHATGRLAANLAHEINNPLGIIKNYLRIVTENLTAHGGGRRATDPNLEIITVVNEEIGRIARIVRQLLDLHRPPEQSATMTDVCALLSDLLALMEDDLRKGGIELVCEFQPDAPKMLVAPDLIRQVFINLLRNAQDAMEDRGGTLTVKCESKMQRDADGLQHVLLVSISDTGTGIEERHLRHIFDPFFTTKSADKGTGLGLAVSYGIIQMYQGSIDVQSKAGAGTTFIVTLPIDPPSPLEAEPPLALENPAAAG